MRLYKVCIDKGKHFEQVEKISNLIQLLVPVMSHCPQTFSVDFLKFLSKRRHLKNLKKSANKFVKNKKFNIIIKKK